MSFPICRVKKIKTVTALCNTEEHNARLYSEKNKPLPTNIKPENDKFEQTSYHQLLPGKNLQDAVEKRLSDLMIKPRENAVLAHEYVLGVSKDWYEKADYDAHGMLNNVVKFIGEKYGPENLASVAFHFDESNPHVHVVVLPIVEKEKKWMNRYGQGSKIVKSLSASDFINGKDTLTKLQDDYFKFISQYNRNDGIIYRGLKVEDQTKKYSKKTIHLFDEINELQKEINLTLDHIKRGEEAVSNKPKLQQQQMSLKKLSDDLEQNMSDLDKAEKKLKYRKGINQNGGWKKGLDFEN